MQFGTLVMFAAWNSEDSIVEFLHSTKLGQSIKSGWHLRMEFLRQWGSVSQLDSLPEPVTDSDPHAPVAAFTLARMRFPEIPRFIKWGKPVEVLVRDHLETTFSFAAIRYPRTVATFSIWNSQKAMVDMAMGHSNVDQPTRHIDAMRERTRRDFHLEFTTLRFRPLSEHGSWEGRKTLLPE